AALARLVDDAAVPHSLELAALEPGRGIKLDRTVGPHRVETEEMVLDITSRTRDRGGGSSGHSNLLRKTIAASLAPSAVVANVIRPAAWTAANAIAPLRRGTPTGRPVRELEAQRPRNRVRLGNPQPELLAEPVGRATFLAHQLLRFLIVAEIFVAYGRDRHQSVA